MSEFLVNTYTQGDQADPDYAILPNGDFVIVWTDGTSYVDGKSGKQSDVYAQRYDYNGNKLGEDFLVNSSYITGLQQGAAVYALDNGFVVFWESSLNDGINAKRYDLDGNELFTIDPYSAEFQVNVYNNADDIEPVVAYLDDGGFIVTWTLSSNIYAQRYDVNGGIVSSEFKVNESTNYYYTTYQVDSTVTALSDGSFVIAWERTTKSNVNAYDATFSLHGQHYDADGTPLGAEFQIRSSELKSDTTVKALNDGGFIVGWVGGSKQYDTNGVAVETTYLTTDIYSKGTLNDGGTIAVSSHVSGSWGNLEIYAQRLDSDGNVINKEFRINTDDSAYQDHNPLMATLTNGDIVVTWTSYGQESYNEKDEVYAQRYDSEFNRIGTEFRVNTITLGGQSVASIVAFDDGGFEIEWNGYQAVDGSQRYDASGNAIDGDLLSDNIYDTDIEVFSDGGYISIFNSYGVDGSGYGVLAQRYDAEGNAIDVIIPINQLTGTTTDDLLNGTAGIDNITTLEGADVVYALAGNDTINLSADSVWSSGYAAQNVSNDASVGTHQKIDLAGLNRFSDVIDGGADVDTLNLTDGNDAFLFSTSQFS